jgi:hypothetical protein
MAPPDFPEDRCLLQQLQLQRLASFDPPILLAQTKTPADLAGLTVCEIFYTNLTNQMGLAKPKI